MQINCNEDRLVLCGRSFGHANGLLLCAFFCKFILERLAQHDMDMAICIQMPNINAQTGWISITATANMSLRYISHGSSYRINEERRPCAKWRNLYGRLAFRWHFIHINWFMDTIANPNIRTISALGDNNASDSLRNSSTLLLRWFADCSTSESMWINLMKRWP